jgi:hypothetical protein
MKTPQRSTVRAVAGFELECWGGPDDGRIQWLPAEGTAVWVYPPSAPHQRLFGAADHAPRAGATGSYRLVQSRRGTVHLKWAFLR